MLLLVMGFLIFSGLYIFGKFGISKNAKAEALALYSSIAALIWSIFQIAVSFSPQYNLYVMLPVIHKIKNWTSDAKSGLLGNSLNLNTTSYNFTEDATLIFNDKNYGWLETTGLSP